MLLFFPNWIILFHSVSLFFFVLSLHRFFIQRRCIFIHPLRFAYHDLKVSIVINVHWYSFITLHLPFRRCWYLLNNNTSPQTFSWTLTGIRLRSLSAHHTIVRSSTTIYFQLSQSLYFRPWALFRSEMQLMKVNGSIKRKFFLKHCNFINSIIDGLLIKMKNQATFRKSPYLWNDEGISEFSTKI